MQIKEHYGISPTTMCAHFPFQILNICIFICMGEVSIFFPMFERYLLANGFSFFPSWHE
jgi:hypothetical protein